ncbi:unknown protein [Desulfotalea psychrophila LSv54]|uniref:Uncharacterized protein n=1 Tax=Desulfotalea psychrophila (strain LSv54 / DSM 12343) TaxID=177439 RepID=Q6AND6_DESPS|nr:unknown protein [Desulfotalea psychrophila LSv54]
MLMSLSPFYGLGFFHCLRDNSIKQSLLDFSETIDLRQGSVMKTSTAHYRPARLSRQAISHIIDSGRPCCLNRSCQHCSMMFSYNIEHWRMQGRQQEKDRKLAGVGQREELVFFPHALCNKATRPSNRLRNLAHFLQKR